MEKSYTAIILAKTELFKDLHPKVLFYAAQEVEVIELEKDTIIFNRGDASNGFYIIVAGEVSFFLEDKEKNTTILKKYDYFGELSLLGNYERLLSAFTKTDCTLLFFSKQIFENLILDVPELLKKLLLTTIQYLRKNLDTNVLKKNIKR